MNAPDHADYLAAVNTEFRVVSVVDPETGRSASSSLTLDEVGMLRVEGGYRSWTLLFRGRADEAFEQGTASMLHDELGELALFLVPIGDTDGIATYESVFSVAAAG